MDDEEEFPSLLGYFFPEAAPVLDVWKNELFLVDGKWLRYCGVPL